MKICRKNGPQKKKIKVLGDCWWTVNTQYSALLQQNVVKMDNKKRTDKTQEFPIN